MRLVEASSNALLAGYGLKAPDGPLCTSAAEALDAAEAIGCPVYVKAQIPFGDRATPGSVARADEPAEAARRVGELLGSPAPPGQVEATSAVGSARSAT